MGLHSHSDAGQYFSFCLVSLGLTICIFFLLRLISASVVAGVLLRFGGGVVPLVGVPTVWLYMEKVLAPFIIVPAYLNWLAVETAIAAMCAVVFAFTNWRVPLWAGAAALVVHFGLWWRVFAEPPLISPALSFAFPVLGLCSTAVWGLYLAHEPAIRHTHAATTST
jgi:hypothetical protein